MAIELKTHKMLWGRSGNRCAFPDCRKELVMDKSETDDVSIIGEEAHIVARKPDGPRGKSLLLSEQRDKYDNLILLCSIHHKIIDDQEDTYNVNKLKKYKADHESWVNSNLQYDSKKQLEDELYAFYIDKVISLAQIDNWKNWTHSIFSGGQPHILQSALNDLESLVEFVISRVWPKSYPELERAFFNLSYVTNDFVNVFKKYSEKDDYVKGENEDGSDNQMEITLWTRKLYHIDYWDTEVYNRLLEKYEYHCLLVEDLMLEITRAINYLFDLSRFHLFPSFRMKEGVLLVVIGPFMDFSYHTYRVEYQQDEKKTLYLGLKEFMNMRDQRDYTRGSGFSKDYFPHVF